MFSNDLAIKPLTICIARTFRSHVAIKIPDGPTGTFCRRSPRRGLKNVPGLDINKAIDRPLAIIIRYNLGELASIRNRYKRTAQVGEVGGIVRVGLLLEQDAKFFNAVFRFHVGYYTRFLGRVKEINPL
jgi:hypothetical protein